MMKLETQQQILMQKKILTGKLAQLLEIYIKHVTARRRMLDRPQAQRRHNSTRTKTRPGMTWELSKVKISKSGKVVPKLTA